MGAEQFTIQTQGSEPRLPGTLGNAGAPASVITRMPAGAIAKIMTLVVSGAALLYALTFRDRYGRSAPLSVVSDNSSAANGAEDIREACAEDTVVSSACSVSRSSATLTFTGLTPGADFTIDESDANLNTPSTTQAAASIAALPYGIGVVAPTTGDAGAMLPSSATRTAQVGSVLATVADDTTYHIIIRIDANGDGIAEDYDVSFTTGSGADAAAWRTAAVAAVNAVMPANSVVASLAVTGTAVVLTAEVAGLPFEARGWNSAASAMTYSATTANATPRFLGFVVRDEAAFARDGVELPSVVPGQRAAILERGERDITAFCKQGDTFAVGQRVWLRYTAGSGELAGAVHSSVDGGDCLPIAWEAIETTPQAVSLGKETPQTYYTIKVRPAA
jgi:hypothetical protein